MTDPQDVLTRITSDIDRFEVILAGIVPLGTIPRFRQLVTAFFRYRTSVDVPFELVSFGCGNDDRGYPLTNLHDSYDIGELSFQLIAELEGDVTYRKQLPFRLEKELVLFYDKVGDDRAKAFEAFRNYVCSFPHTETVDEFPFATLRLRSWCIGPDGTGYPLDGVNEIVREYSLPHDPMAE